MTWTKTHTSTILPDPGASSFEGKNFHQQWDEVLGWLQGRGWTVTPKSDNHLTKSVNFYNIQKPFTSYEGVPQNYTWHLQNSISGITMSSAILNGRAFALESLDETQAKLKEKNNIWPTDVANGIEIWESDQDNDSFIINSRSATGVCKVLMLFPGEGSIRSGNAQTSGNYGCYHLCFLPWFTYQPVQKGTSLRQIAWGEVEYQLSNYDEAVPVITKNEISIHDGTTLLSKWRQNDIATLEDLTAVPTFWDVSASSQLTTLLIDGDYYIAMGYRLGTNVALLNTGAVNPLMNL